ncbi:alpha/beta hydrolase [Ornithinimicrobium sp. Arc0846-15]|nr:alpha/beta hydrolase [Ornithinimicrobium laminariae]
MTKADRDTARGLKQRLKDAMATFHPDLKAGKFIPQITFGPRLVRLLNRSKPSAPPEVVDLIIEDRKVPGPPGAPEVTVRLFQPRALRGAAPALLWMHGGGMMMGNRAENDQGNIDFARTLGITVVSVEYRLSPQHPAPAALEDCYAAFAWVAQAGEDLGIDPARIAIGGASAGGGLTAGLALMAHDRGEIQPVFQLLVYPMLDDRTTLRDDVDSKGLRGWNQRSNMNGWTSYLDRAPGGAGVSDYAAPARRADLSGLPPAWIGVGTLDLFHDEDVTYARRLTDAGVPVQLDIIPGAFHAFDTFFSKKDVSKKFWCAQADALRSALF